MDLKKEDAMKGLRTILCTLAVSLAAAPSAFAGATKVYSSSMLVLAFVGFLALVVAIQLIPAIMTLFGAIKGITKKHENIRVANVEAGK
jgi:hypothetical protein